MNKKTKGKGDDPAYQPRMTDPASGRKLIRGRPVDNAGPTKPNPSVKDPVSGQMMKRGSPVPTAYSGALNQRFGQGLETAGRAVAAGFKPPGAGAKGDGMRLKKPKGKK